MTGEPVDVGLAPARAEGAMGPRPVTDPYVRMTDGDWAAALAAGEERHAAARSIDAATGRVPINKFRADEARAHAEGFIGEWAVADALGVPRPRDVSGRADAGHDLVTPWGQTLAVRFNRRRTGRLMCPSSRPFKADYAVLVVPAGAHDTDVWIAGGLPTVEFYLKGTETQIRVLTVWVDQADLRPWAELVRGWRRGAA